MTCTVINVCWGGEFTRWFAEASLPTLLTPDNLPYLGKNHNAVYRFYTTEADLAYLKTMPSWKMLEQVMRVEIRMAPSMDNRYSRMTACHTDALRELSDGERRLIFISPDLLYSNAFMRNLAGMASSRAVMLCPLITFYWPEFAARRPQGQAVWNLTGRQLVACSIEHADDFMPSMRWRSDGILQCPACPIWPVGDAGFVAHCFGAHPLMVWPRQGVKSVEGLTIDGNFVMSICKGEEEVAVVTDSDQLCALGEKNATCRDLHFQQIDPFKFIRDCAPSHNAQYKHCFKHAVRFRTADIEPTVWAEVEAEADKIVQFYLEHESHNSLQWGYAL